MTEYDWHQIYTAAVEAFGGDTPSATLEAELLDTFKNHPEQLLAAIDKIGGAYRQGRVQSPWGALKSELARIRNRPHLIVSSDKQQTKRIRNAQQWLRNAGLYCPGWGACQETLVDDFHLTEQQAATLRDLYQELAPAGRQAERDMVSRGQAWLASQRSLADLKRQKRAELDAAQNFPAAT